ncbi:unnamed protein product [Linum trigynum]|uniref:Cytochrome P450 n=1 Tax=Linum trigynum TaxID=586398 RepID=A0AAV2DQ42_9ROSI
MATFLVSLLKDETSASLFTISIAILVSAGLYFLTYLRRTPNSMPGPRGLPIVGYMPFLRPNHLHRQFTALAQAHGPIYKIQTPSKLLVVVSSPALAREVLRANESTFSARPTPIAVKILGYGGMEVGTLPWGPDWAGLRKILVRDVLSNRALDTCHALRERAVAAGIREIRAESIGKPTRVFDAAFKLVVDSTLAMLWGGGDGEGGADFAAEYREATREVSQLMGRPNVSDAFPLLARFDLQGVQREAAVLAARMDGMISSVIERRLGDLAGKKGMASKDLLQILLEVQGGGGDLSTGSLIASTSSVHFKGLILDIASGGTNTTAMLIEWAITELLSNEEVMIKVVQELDRIVGPKSLMDDHHLKELSYLNAVVKETCRLHLAMVARVAGQPCTVGGYSIPKGATVLINTWAIHRDPQLWADPLQFRPERFLNEVENGPRFSFTGSNFQYLPFGSGHRVCAGLNLAERLMNHVLASMLHSFEWKLPDGEERPDFSDKFGPFVRKQKPLIAIPFLRPGSGLA